MQLSYECYHYLIHTMYVHFAPCSLEHIAAFGEIHSTDGSKVKKASVQLHVLFSAPYHNNKHIINKIIHKTFHDDMLTLGKVASTA